MRKFITCLLLLTCACTAIAQKQFKKTFYRQDSVFIYPFPYYNWEYYYNTEEEDAVRDHLRSSDGLFLTSIALPDGKWIAYFNKPEFGAASEQKDKIAMEFFCKGGKLDGPALVYARNGKVIARGDYHAGNKNGTWLIYTINGKKLKEKLNYIEGEPDGYWEIYDNGKLSKRLHFANGKKEGEWISFYPDGKTEEVAHYKDGKGYGEAKAYFLNGKIRSSGNFN